MSVAASLPALPPILPGATLGVLGGGQLGKMFCAAAQRMGYQVWILDPDNQCPAATIADTFLCADFDDKAALQNLGQHCAAITTEFENVPASSLALLAQFCPVFPSAEAVSIVQHRWKEKSFLRDNGFPTAPFWHIEKEADLHNVAPHAFPAILKVSQFGYDGKGQVSVADATHLSEAWAALNHVPCLLEKRLSLDLEISVMVARTSDGKALTWPVSENHHHEGILDTSIVPARIPENLAHQVREIALKIAQSLNYVGILGVEAFVVGGQLYINELAPRPHNSGHYTLEASVTSQFEQQVRVLCNLPLGNTDLLSPAVMLNLLGDIWQPTAPDWSKILALPGMKLHLYGKHTPRSKRKMGHLTCLSSALDRSIECIEWARKQLNDTHPSTL